MGQALFTYLRPLHIRQDLCEASRLELRRQHQGEMGHPRGIEIGLKGQIDALTVYLLKQRRTLVIHPLVRDMDGDTRLLGKLKGFFPRLFPSEDSVADMCGIDGAV